MNDQSNLDAALTRERARAEAAEAEVAKLKDLYEAAVLYRNDYCERWRAAEAEVAALKAGSVTDEEITAAKKWLLPNDTDQQIREKLQVAQDWRLAAMAASNSALDTLKQDSRALREALAPVVKYIELLIADGYAEADDGTLLSYRDARWTWGDARRLLAVVSRSEPAATIDARVDRIRELEGALRPFADELSEHGAFAWPLDLHEENESVFLGAGRRYGDLTYGDFRRAHEALSRTAPPASSPDPQDRDKDAWIAEAAEVWGKLFEIVDIMGDTPIAGSVDMVSFPVERVREARAVLGRRPR